MEPRYVETNLFAEHGRVIKLSEMHFEQIFTSSSSNQTAINITQETKRTLKLKKPLISHTDSINEATDKKESEILSKQSFHSPMIFPSLEPGVISSCSFLLTKSREKQTRKQWGLGFLDECLG